MSYKQYAVFVKQKGNWYPILNECSDNTCYVIAKECATIFGTKKQASKMIREIKDWIALGMMAKQYIPQQVKIAEVKIRFTKKRFVK